MRQTGSGPYTHHQPRLHGWQYILCTVQCTLGEINFHGLAYSIGGGRVMSYNLDAKIDCWLINLLWGLGEDSEAELESVSCGITSIRFEFIISWYLVENSTQLVRCLLSLLYSCGYKCSLSSILSLK